MRTKEGRPSGKEEGARQSARTIEHTTTHRAFAHRVTPSDAVVWTAFTLGVALFLFCCCAAAWLVS